MKKSTLYKSNQAKQDILAIYDQKLGELGIDFQSEIVETSFGQTHILITGSADNPPLILVHGSNGCAPIALETYPNLSKKYQVFAVDVLAQPNKSAETRLSMKDDSYGQWINEIINHYELKNITMVGFSLGGLITLKTLINDEEKIKEVFLAAPAYIVNGNPIKALLKVFLPMKKYMRTKNPKQVGTFLDALFSEKDPFAIKFLSKVFLHFDMDFTPVPTIKKAEAKSIQTPITLFAAGKDIMFPGQKMIRRAKKIFPSLKEVMLLDDSKHVQSRNDLNKIESIILNK